MDFEEEFKKLKLDYMKGMSEKISVLENNLIKIEKKEDTKENFKIFLRDVHTIKGTAGSYGFNFFTTICHKLEDYVEANSKDILSGGILNTLSYIDIIREAASVLSNDINANEASFYKKLDNLEGTNNTTGPRCLSIGKSGILKKVLEQVYIKSHSHGAFCNDSIEALGRITEEKFDYLITPLESSRIDGISLARAINVIDGLPHKPKIILFTSTKIKDKPSAIDHIIYKNKEAVDELVNILST